MREKSNLSISDPVGHIISFQKIDHRYSALIIPIQNRRLLFAPIRHFKQIAVLGLAVPERDLSDFRPLRRAVCANHVFGVPERIPLYKAVRRTNDSAAGAIILLHQQYFGTSVLSLKIYQRLRTGGPEAVNTLVFVSDHEEIVMF